MKISPARLAAFEVLTKIEKDKAFSSVLLPLAEENLSAGDRALCHQITLGVLRRQIYLDKIIESFTNDKKLDSAVIIALRIGLYQLLFLDKIPAYSAINESVNLVQKAKKTSAKSFVNAVLRRATREKIALNFADETQKLAVETSHPRWLIEKWIAQFGRENAALIARENNEIPPVAFRFVDKNRKSGAFNDADFVKSEYAENCYKTEKISDAMTEAANKGEIYFQDEGSQLIGQAVNLEKNQRFLDACAAPGSKTTQIATANSDLKTENLFVGGDVHFRRAKFLRENCRRQNAEFVAVVQYDAEKSLPFADESFDKILIDAPCSGTGTIRHNPEIRYFLTKEDFAELSAKQLKILTRASKLIKPGGTLIYSTCSLEIEENEAVCRNFSAENQEFTQVTPNVPKAFLTADNFARTFPPQHEMDGFFIAAFTKK